MADIKPKSRKPFRQDKYPVYQALARIDQAFEVIETELVTLQNSGVVPFEPVNVYRSKELRPESITRLSICSRCGKSTIGHFGRGNG